MRTPLIAILLCALASAASAGDMSTPAANRQAAAGTSTTVAKAEPTPKAELIGSAAAAVHDPSEVVRAPHREAARSGDTPHDGGLAMLFAAIAVMAGIALRRLTRDR